MNASASFQTQRPGHPEAGSPAADIGPTHLLAVDIGGTFTDLVLVEIATGQSRIAKVLTTPSAPVDCVRTGMNQLLAAAGLTGGALESVIHATTLATNIVTEGKGAHVVVLNTDGFRDVLETGREGRYDAYDLQIQLAPSLVQRRHRIGVRERMDWNGNAVTELKAAEIERVVAEVTAASPEAVAICLLHSYANRDHEHALADALTRTMPGIPISISVDVLPKQGEYERLMATVINSYVRPDIEVYLNELERFCKEIGYAGGIYLMMSNGGMASIAVASRLPARMIESGPAAGVIGAALIAKGLSLERVLSFDMGGTTAKACLIEQFRPPIASHLEVARLQRFAPGSGYPLALPSVDLLEIGAGGGSIARIDALGLLQVGPDSAGADPGPACYGNGGLEPTVTDANLVLGLLNPAYFLGGRMHVDPHAAQRAIADRLAGQLDQEPLECAWGIFDVVNEDMAGALRIHAVEQGVDPRTCTMIAFGGGGPMHACAVARKLGISHIVCPDGAGVGSAVGLAAATRISEEMRTRIVALSDVDDQLADQLLRPLVTKATGTDSTDSGGSDNQQISYFLDLRLSGQLHEFSLELQSSGGAPVVDRVQLAATFLTEYERRFGRRPDGSGIEVVTWRVRVASGSPATKAGTPAAAHVDSADNAPLVKGSRDIYLGPAGHMTATVIDRYVMSTHDHVAGPAIIEERESTVLVLPGFAAATDAARNLHITKIGTSEPTTPSASDGDQQ